ncbi:MAG TPA: hypothetical protein VHS32_10115 [Streptosporangiaceae bacterium]|nr:hypothetical protein [Streptosporangiaceae bacterium]
MARLQDRAVRGAGTRGEVALDKLDRSAQVMRSLRRPARRCHEGASGTEHAIKGK